MLNRSASLAMSTSVLKALPGKLDIKRHSPSILYKMQLFRWYVGCMNDESNFYEHDKFYAHEHEKSFITSRPGSGDSPPLVATFYWALLHLLADLR